MKPNLIKQEILLRAEWAKEFPNKPFPALEKITEEDIKWAKGIIKHRG